MRLLPDCVPGSYLYLTRIGGGRALAGYVWLEVAPLALAMGAPGPAALFILCHWAFLGLYELGYVWNDAADTAAERPERPRPAPGHRGLFVAARIGLLLVAAAGVALAGDPRAAGLYLVLAGAVLALLGAHTAVGQRPAADPWTRTITFGWLAFAKYLPALCAVRPPREALAWAAFAFLCYGGGRVAAYAVAKAAREPRAGPLDANACWFLASLPATLAALWAGIVPAAAGAVLLLAYGSNHLATAAWRWRAIHSHPPSGSRS